MNRDALTSDPALEHALLGGILNEPADGYPLAAGLIRADDLVYYNDVFEVMGGLHRAGITPDTVAVLDELRKRNLLEGVGGSGVIMAMLTAVPSGANIEAHCRKVLEASRKRSLDTLAMRGREALRNPDATADSVGALLSSGIERILSRGVREAEIHYLRDIADAEAARLTELYTSGHKAVEGVTYGFEWLDTCTMGRQPGDFNIIAARPNTGKSKIITFSLCSAAAEGHRVGFISLDMAPAKLYPYLTLCAANMGGESATLRDIYNPYSWTELSEARLRDIFAAVDRERRWVLVDEPSNYSVAGIEGYCRTLVQKHGCKVVAVDQLQNVEGWDRGARDRSLFSEIGSGLKRIPRRYKFALEVAHQIQREGAAAPTLANLKDSGVAEEYTDTVIILHDPQRALCDTYGGFIRTVGGGVKAPKTEAEQESKITQVDLQRPVRVGLEKSRSSEIRREHVLFDYSRGIRI